MGIDGTDHKRVEEQIYVLIFAQLKSPALKNIGVQLVCMFYF